jgi:hypothetical protein
VSAAAHWRDGGFGEARPIVGVVHLAPSLGTPSFPGHQAAREALGRDLDALLAGGIDGVLLENDNDRPHTLQVGKPQLAWLTRAACEARARCAKPLGLGVQRIDWEASIAIVAAAELDFVRLDVFVDRVRMLDQTVEVDPRAVVELRRRLGAQRVQLWTDIQVKHAELVEGRPIEQSACAAAAAGSDAILVTGARTGDPPALGHLRCARAAAAPLPVLIGSGLTAANAAELAGAADGALVGTALKRGDRVDPVRVREVVGAWRAACASPR